MLFREGGKKMSPVCFRGRVEKRGVLYALQGGWKKEEFSMLSREGGKKRSSLCLVSSVNARVS